MAHCPDFSDTDSDFSDDLEYHDFKERTKYNNARKIEPRVLTEQEKKDVQLKSFFSALSSGYIQAVCEHLDSGLDVNVNIQDGWTPLLLAASFGNPELTAELIHRGADVNSDRNGCTALMMACTCPKSTSPFEKSLEVVKLLVENGANVKAVNRKRMTALMFAADTGNLNAVKYLLPLSDKNAEDNQKWTALFWAVNNNEVETVKYFLQEGFDTTVVDVRNNTPLDIAKHGGFEKIVELFPDDTTDVISDIIDSYSCSFEDTFKNLKKGERPKFILDVCNILCGLRNESLMRHFAEKDIGLYEFLSISDKELKDLDIKLPYQRNRISRGIFRFHKHPFYPTSLHVVPLDENYSNIDMAAQLLSSIKQVIVMEAGLKYLIDNYYDPDDKKENLELAAKNIDIIRNKIKLCKLITTRLREKTIMLDSQVKPVDLITAKSRRYRVPWRKIVFSVSVLSIIVAFRVWK